MTDVSCLKRIAVVQGDAHLDLPLMDACGRLSLVRCATSPDAEDQKALETMLIERTFVFAALLYEDRQRSVLEGPIPAFHASEMDDLVARLVREAEA